MAEEERHIVVAELTSSGVSQPADEERRIARDGKAYTWLEFMEFYSESAAAPIWSSADIHRAAEERSGASDGHADAAVNTLLTPQTAEEIRTSTRIAGTCKNEMPAAPWKPSQGFHSHFQTSITMAMSRQRR